MNNAEIEILSKAQARIRESMYLACECMSKEDKAFNNGLSVAIQIIEALKTENN